MYIKDILYEQDVERVLQTEMNWQQLNGKTFLIIGASGMIGTFVIDVLMRYNEQNDAGLKILVLGRNRKRLEKRFSSYCLLSNFYVLEEDITNELHLPINCDYIFHGASNTHPLAYAEDPIGTIMTNLLGTQRVLEYASSHDCARVLFMSTVEIYGENRDNVESFKEDYCGYIDCNTLRSGYPEGKRASESLCQAYIAKYGIDIVIPRICRTFGPTMQINDSKASSQFIKNAVNNEDIILKSKGEQFFSYGYVGDVVSALLFILIHGKNGEAYNIASEKFNVHLNELAESLASISGKKVIYQLPDEKEQLGFSKVKNAILSSEKLNDLGWTPKFSLIEALEHTVRILKDIKK